MTVATMPNHRIVELHESTHEPRLVIQVSGPLSLTEARRLAHDVLFAVTRIEEFGTWTKRCREIGADTT